MKKMDKAFNYKLQNMIEFISLYHNLSNFKNNIMIKNSILVKIIKT